MKTDRTSLSPAIPISLRRWIIARDELATQFVCRALGLDTKRSNEIRKSGIVTEAERDGFCSFFSINQGRLAEALEASRRHYSELALLS